MLQIPENTPMKVFKGEAEEPFDKRVVSDEKQAMYYIQGYNDEDVYGEVVIDGKTYIVGASDVEAAF